MMGRPMRTRLVGLLAALLLLAASGSAEEKPKATAQPSTAEPGNAQPSPPAVERERQEGVARMAPIKARALDVLVGEAGADKAALHGEPLLRWSNPTVGSVYGEVFLWHVEGRPAAVASIYRWFHPYHDSTLEIVSLSPKAVVVREGEAVDWDCRSAGVTFQPATIAAPAPNRLARLAQMRAFARRFAAELSDERGGERTTRQLRLLNQPAYRYESPRQNVIDGALFAFAEATDPEAWLMIEATGKGNTLSWRYALARMNSDELQVRLDGAVVQTWAHIDQPWNDRKSSYTLFTFEPPVEEPSPRKP